MKSKVSKELKNNKGVDSQKRRAAWEKVQRLFPENVIVSDNCQWYSVNMSRLESLDKEKKMIGQEEQNEVTLKLREELQMITDSQH